MIGSVSSDEKAKLAKVHVINYCKENFVERVRELTDGQGPTGGVVYDNETFFDSLDCLSPLGMMVICGNASRPVLGAGLRAERDVVTWPTLILLSGQRGKLNNAQQANRDLEARLTTGSSILIP